jgi:tetratricopeptide (TPR) repeat protein
MIIPLILIFIGLSIVVGIVVRKFSQLVLLNVDSIPAVKENKKKDEIIRKRAEKNAENLYGRLSEMFQPLIRLWKGMQFSFRKYVGILERKVNQELQDKKPLSKEERIQKKKEAKELSREAMDVLSHGDLEAAEKKFISAIAQDPKNILAYKGLGEVYMKQNHTQEAKETFTFVLQLNPDDEETLLRLGEISESEGNKEKAVEYYQQAVILNPNNPLRFVKIYDLLFGLGHYGAAFESIRQAVELEPQNPKYLDKFIEASILLPDKKMAEEGYQQLRMINPENQKLPSFRQRIDEMK